MKPRIDRVAKLAWIGMAVAVACGVALLAGWSRVEDERPPPPKHLRSSLRPADRQVVQAAMLGHAHDMQRLVLAVALLDYGEVAKLARTVGDRPIFPEPMRERLRRAGLSSRFFKEADLLRTRAAALEAVAVMNFPQALAPAFGAVTESCVTCHSAYLGD